MILILLVVTVALLLKLQGWNDLAPASPQQGSIDAALLASNNTWTGTNTFNNTLTIGAVSDTTKTLTFNTANQTTGTAVTFNTGAQTASRIASLPVLAGNDTFAMLGVANTFTNNNIISTTTGNPLAVIGPASSAGNSPNIAYQFTSDTDPGMSMLVYAHDNIQIGFDSYYTSGGNWKASNTTAFQLGKVAGLFQICGNSGLTKGNTFSQNAAFITMTTAGIITLTNATAANAGATTGAVVSSGGFAAVGAYQSQLGFGVGVLPTAGVPLSLSAAFTGNYAATISNTAAGTANIASLLLNADVSTTRLQALSSTFTANNVLQPSSGGITVTGAGGAFICASGGTGTINFASGGVVVNTTVSAAGLWTHSIAGANTLTVTSTGSNASVLVNGFTAFGSILQFATNGTNQGKLYAIGTTPFVFFDQLAGTPWSTLIYTSGNAGVGYWTFTGTLDASSSTAAANVMSGGLAVAKNINNAGTITTSGGAIILTGQITIESATAAATNDTVSHIYRTNGSGSGDFATSGNVIIQPRTATATPMDFIVYTGATTGVERLRVLSTGVCRLGAATVPAANTFAGNISWGRNTGAADTAGAVGETIVGAFTGVAAALTTATGNVGSVSLTAGKWLVSGKVVVHAGATGLTVSTTIQASCPTTTAGTGTSGTTMVQQSVPAVNIIANGLFTLNIDPQVVNISATTSQFLTCNITYAAGLPTFDGSITAVRLA